MVMTQAFNGAGDTMTPTRLNLVCFWGVQVPLAWILANGFGLGPAGVFWAVALAESLLAVLSVLVFRRGRWKTVEIAADARPAPTRRRARQGCEGGEGREGAAGRGDPKVSGPSR
jgi:Na+-driven multidrug efflux pump